MQYNRQDIENLDHVQRLKMINSVTGVKPANLIGTINKHGVTNLAVFSSVVHLGSSPALLGFVTKSGTEDVGHTIQNIKEMGAYTINHIHPEFSKQAHYTSAKFERKVSEFDACGLQEEYVEDFKAPFVKESNFKMGMRFKEAIPIPLNGTVLVVGEIDYLQLPDEAISEGNIDLEKANSMGISGLDSYYELKKTAQYPYVLVNEVPDF
jgi:flavin reductase (DIM6/NTAB) family NADH-FMN oxidoreductase RutF